MSRSSHCDVFERMFGPNRVPPQKSVEDLVVIFFAEFIGTAIMVFIGCLGCTLVRINITENSLGRDDLPFDTSDLAGHKHPWMREKQHSYGVDPKLGFVENIRRLQNAHEGTNTTKKYTEGFHFSTDVPPNLLRKDIHSGLPEIDKRGKAAGFSSVDHKPTTSVKGNTNTSSPVEEDEPTKTVREESAKKYQMATNKAGQYFSIPVHPEIRQANKTPNATSNPTSNTTSNITTVTYNLEISPIVGISFGLGIMIATQIFAHISLGHFNPAVSLAAFILCHIRITYMLVYWCAQICGSLLAAGFMYGLSSYKQFSTGWCLTRIIGVTTCQAFFIEFLLSLILVIVYSAASDECHQHHQETWSVRYGLVTAGLVLAGTNFTMGSINPIRGFGPGLLNLPFELSYWIYWVAPLLAALFGAFIYRGVFRDRYSESNEWFLFWDCLRGDMH